MLALALARPAVARADLVTPPGGRECSLEARRQAGEHCVACAAQFSDPTSCAVAHAHRGYAFRCRGKGDVAWIEVWCKTGDEGPSSLTEPPDAAPEVGSPAPEPPGPVPPPTVVDASTNTTGPSEPVPAVGPRPVTRSSPSVLAPAEKRGSCGACALGARSEALPSAAFALLAAALALCRRAQRLMRSRSITCVGSASSMLERNKRSSSNAASSPLPAARSK
jgi:hypothetical protein